MRNNSYQNLPLLDEQVQPMATRYSTGGRDHLNHLIPVGRDHNYRNGDIFGRSSPSVMFKEPSQQLTLCQRFMALSIILKILLFFAIIAIGIVLLDAFFTSEKEFEYLFDPSGSGDTAALPCDAPNYAKFTLKLAYEATFFSMFKDGKEQKRFDATDVVKVDNNYYIVCESSWYLLKLSNSLTSFSDTNVQIGEVNREDGEPSGYVAIFYNSRKHNFHIVRESATMFDTSSREGRFYAIVEEMQVGEDGGDYTVLDVCPTEFSFLDNSRGFAGAEGVYAKDGTFYVLGLCADNHCETGKNGHDVGNGKVVVMKREVISSPAVDCYGGISYQCVWKTLRVMDLPKSASFDNYSSISVSGDGRVAVVSQMESKVWIGYLSYWSAKDKDKEGQQQQGTFDPEKSNLVELNSAVYAFPRDDQCATIYCNIQGVQWLSDNTLVTVSDHMRSKGKQDFRCLAKDQSIQIFAIPP